MISKTILAVLAATAVAHPVLEVRQSTNQTFENWISRQFNISLEGALYNVGGVNGNVVPGALEGFVVASPSTVNPDYFYTWTRDSALTQLMFVDELIFGRQTVGNNSLQVVAEQYGAAQAELQTVTNPSGQFYPAGQGLGEPKFYTNGTRFNGAWGRPQNDGPALRASAIMEIAEAIYLRNPNWSSIVSNIYWPIIYNDLLYVAQYWNTSSYDLWEEVNGNSVFTLVAQHRALVQGTIWAQRLNKTCTACQQAPQIACFLSKDFYNTTGNYILADINTNQVTRSGINADPILAAMHAFDINATCNAAALQPCNSKVLATHKVWVDSFRNLYPVNKNASLGPVLTGRYPEDTYYGGNPWYITTLAAAEVLYDAAAQFNKAGSLTIDNISLAFWQDLYPNATQSTYTGNALANLTNAMRSYADGFVSTVYDYTPSNGTLNEQINATTGEPLSAIALTWSFAAFVTAIDRREGKFPPSWGANSTAANNVSSTCRYSAYNATTLYTPALAAGASSVNTSTCYSEVLFELIQETGSGENTYIVGNTSFLGNTLNETGGVIQVMRTNNATDKERLWFTPAWLPAGIPVAYKYVLLNSTNGNYSFKFENLTRYAYPPACGNTTVPVLRNNGSFSTM